MSPAEIAVSLRVGRRWAFRGEDLEVVIITAVEPCLDAKGENSYLVSWRDVANAMSSGASTLDVFLICYRPAVEA